MSEAQNEQAVVTVCENDGDCMDEAVVAIVWRVGRERFAKRLCPTHAERIVMRAVRWERVVVEELTSVDQLPLPL